MPTPLGERLKAARHARGWSLREVESRTEIRNAHLSQIETGAIERPDPNILHVLAGAYGLDFPDLMRLAGHARGDDQLGVDATVAWRALEELSPEERRDVLAFMAELRRKRQGAGDE
jgi:HTH-type transcriptional regulator, competence development regulator